MKCATCRHWRQLAKSYSDDGACQRVGVSVYLGNRTVVLHGNILPVGPAAPRLVTDHQFGCVMWEKNK